MRLTGGEKDTLTKAADATGVDLSTFVRRAAMDRAREQAAHALAARINSAVASGSLSNRYVATVVGRVVLLKGFAGVVMFDSACAPMADFDWTDREAMDFDHAIGLV